MKYTASLLLAAALCGTPFIAGCDKTVSEKETVRTTSDGSTKTRDEKVTEHPDGSVSKTTETKTNNQ